MSGKQDSPGTNIEGSSIGASQKAPDWSVGGEDGKDYEMLFAESGDCARVTFPKSDGSWPLLFSFFSESSS